MNKSKPIGKRNISTIAGYTSPTRPKPSKPKPKQAFEVTPDLNDEVVEVPVSEALSAAITVTEKVAEADGVIKQGVEVPADGKKSIFTLGEDKNDEDEKPM